MNGAEALLRTFAQAGVDTCFANPGTTEIQLVAALDEVSEIRPVLSLFEGVCTGAADGYGRITGRPALTLVHLGPGFANGLANLHNARRARSPIINLVGDHASWHLAADAPLASDIVGLASPMSNWVHSAKDADSLPADGAAAVAAALAPPGQVATLIVPQDAQWSDSSGPAPAPTPAAPATVPAAAIDAAASALRDSTSVAIMLGGPALRAPALRAAQRVTAASGDRCRVFIETFGATRDAGRHLPDFPRLPYFPEPALEALEGIDTLILAGALDPVAFFGYPDTPSRLTPESAAVVTLCEPQHDCVAALETLADALGAPSDIALDERTALEPASGELKVSSLGQALAAAIPENAIVVSEAATSAAAFEALSAAANPHTTLGLTGGAIGQGLPTAVGAAIAAPDQPVLCFEADGSGMYTVQSLWTMAREALDVTVVIAANDAYRILQAELGRAGVDEPGPAARALTALSGPRLDWVTIAKGFGVPASQATTADELNSALANAVAEAGPHLIEALV